MPVQRNSTKFCFLFFLGVAIFFSLSCDKPAQRETSVNVWTEDAAHIYTATTAKNIGIGTKHPSSPFSVFRNGLPMSGTGFAVGAFDPNDPDRGVWLGYDASDVIGIVGADSDGIAASQLAFWTHDGTSFAEKARLVSSGDLGLGTSRPTERMHVVGNLRVQGDVDCVVGQSAGGMSCSSDERLKNNVRLISDPVEKIFVLRGVEFEWGQKAAVAGRQGIGLIAQDVEKVFPTAVSEGKDGYKMIDYAVLVAPLVEAVKEIEGHLMKLNDKDIRELKERNAALTQELDAVKGWICSKDPSAVWCAGKE